MKLHGRQLEQVHHNLLDAQGQEKQSRQRLAEAQRLARFWEGLDFHYQNGRPAAALLVLSEEYQRVRETTLFDQNQSAFIEEIRLECHEAAAQTARIFVREFPDAARASHIDIDSTSRHPKYSVRQGFISIEINDRNYTATMKPRDGVAIRLGLDVDQVVERLKMEIARLFDRRFEADTFLKTLFRSYSAVIRAEKRQDGEAVPIRKVMNRLSKNLNKFSADQFNIDLVKLLGIGQAEIEGRKMRLEHTRRIREGILLHGQEAGGYIGFISFKTEDK